MHALGDPLQAFPQGALLGAQRGNLLVLPGTGRLGFGQAHLRLDGRGSDRVEHRGQGLDHPLGRVALPRAQHGKASGFLGGGPVPLALAFEVVGPGRLGADPLPRGLHQHALVQFGGARRLQFGEHALTRVRVQHGTGSGAGGGQFRGGRGGGRLGIPDPLRRQLQCSTQPFRLGGGGFDLHPHPVESLGLRRQLGIKIPQRRERRRRLLLGALQQGTLLGQQEPALLELNRDPVAALGRGIALREQFDPARLAPGAATQHMLGQHLAGAGDDRHEDAARAQLRQRGARRREVVGDHGGGQQRPDTVGGIDHVDDRRDAGDAGEGRVGWRAGAVRVGDHDLQATEVPRPGVVECGHRRLVGVRKQRLGQGAQRRRDGALEPGLDLHTVGHDADHAVDPRADDHPGTVGQVHRPRERTGLGGQGVALPFGLVHPVPDPVDLRPDRADPRLGALVPAVEVALAPVGGGRLRLKQGELGLGRIAALPSLVQSALLAQHLAAHRCQSRIGSISLTGQGRELQVVQGDQCALGGDLLIEGIEPCPRRGRHRDGYGQGFLAPAQRIPKSDRLVTGVLHLGFGHTAGCGRRLRRGAEQHQPLLGEVVQPAQPLLGLLETERQATGLVHGIAALLLLDPVLAEDVLVQLLLHHDSFTGTLMLAPVVVVERRP